MPTGTPGVLRSLEADGRTYAALSESMTLLDECPAERFVAASLARTDDGLVWCWDELRVLIDLPIEPVRLPRALATSTSPVAAYVELDGAPAFLCTADDVARFALGGLEPAHAS